MVPELKFRDEELVLKRQTAFGYLVQRDYKSLADLVKENTELAKVHGQYIVDAMYNTLLHDHKPLDCGYQLTGDQLQVLAYTRKAGAPVGEGVITIRFDYVARIEREGRGYVAEFPDLPGCVTQDKTLAATKESAQEALNGYVSSKMLHGDTLPAPKYHGRKTKNVRPFKVQLTLADLVFEDDKEIKEEQAREDFAHRTELAKLKAR